MLLGEKVEWERFLRENILFAMKYVFVYFLCCGLRGGRGQSSGLSCPPGRPWEESLTEACLRHKAPAPLHTGDTPMFCLSQGPVPPPTPSVGAAGPLCPSSQLPGLVAPGAPGFQCWLQEEPQWWLPPTPQAPCL